MSVLAYFDLLVLFILKIQGEFSHFPMGCVMVKVLPGMFLISKGPFKMVHAESVTL